MGVPADFDKVRYGVRIRVWPKLAEKEVGWQRGCIRTGPNPLGEKRGVAMIQYLSEPASGASGANYYDVGSLAWSEAVDLPEPGVPVGADRFADDVELVLVVDVRMLLGAATATPADQY